MKQQELGAIISGRLYNAKSSSSNSSFLIFLLIVFVANLSVPIVDKLWNIYVLMIIHYLRLALFQTLLNFLLAQILEQWNAVLRKNLNNLKLINALISGISVDRLLSYSRWSEGHWIYNINTLVKCCESLAIVVLKYWLYCVIASAPMTFFFCKLLSPDVTCMDFFAWKRVYEFSWKFLEFWFR